MADMKAMLTGVFAKAAEAKGKAVRGAMATPAAKAPAVPRRDTAVRLSLGPEAAADAPARPPQPTTVDPADRLEPAIRTLARDLGRLLAAFGMDGSDAVEAALAARFGDAERRAAVAALDGRAGDLRPLAEDGRLDVVIEVSGIGLALGPVDGPVRVRLEDAVLMLAQAPAEEKGEGLAGVLGILRSAIRPGKGLTVATDRVAIDDLGRVMAALSQAMAKPPQGLEGALTLTPLGVPEQDGGALELTLSLSGRLGEMAALEPAKPMPAKEKPAKKTRVDEIKERGFDVRI